jgi:FMN reductase
MNEPSSEPCDIAVVQRSPHIVGIGGTMRQGSGSEKALRYALETARKLGASIELFSGPDLALPHYEPGHKLDHPMAARLISELNRADGVIVASPGYHGSISGLLKNVFDYMEEMRTGTRVYLEGRAVGCIVVANGAQALGSTLATVRSIVHALRGWPTPYAATILSSSGIFQDGQPANSDVANALEIVANEVFTFAEMSKAHQIIGQRRRASPN